MTSITKREAAFAGALLVGLVLILWGHGLFLAARSPRPPAGGQTWEAVLAGLGNLGIPNGVAGPLLGGVTGTAAVIVLAMLAAGIDGLRPAALVAPLLTVLSPGFAAATFGGGQEPLVSLLLIGGSTRAFSETHTAGRLPLSALLFGAAAALDAGGLAILFLVFVQKIIFARRFRLTGHAYVFGFIWLAIGLLAAGVPRLVIGAGAGSPGAGVPATGGAAPGMDPLGGGSATGVVRVLIIFWQEVDGLAILPFLLILLFGWKSKAVFFRLTLVASILLGWVLSVSRAPAATMPIPLAPALPFAFLAVGEALANATATFETVGLRGPARTGLISLYLSALALGQIWPSLVMAIPGL